MSHSRVVICTVFRVVPIVTVVPLVPLVVPSAALLLHFCGYLLVYKLVFTSVPRVIFNVSSGPLSFYSLTPHTMVYFTLSCDFNSNAHFVTAFAGT